MTQGVGVPNISSANLTDKEIRNLYASKNKYIKAVGNPKELYIRVYPSGKKTFCLLYNEKMIKIKEFREGIYSVFKARKDAIKLLKELEGGKSLAMIGNDQFNFKNLSEKYQQILQNKGVTPRYLKQISQRIQSYLYPKLAKRDVKDIHSSELFEILQSIYTPHDHTNHLEIIYRLISYLINIFALAIEDGYIDNNPAINLKNKFLTPKKFNQRVGIDSRRKALVED